MSKKIQAEAHTDDRVCEIAFDAAPYFEHVDAEDLLKLAVSGWSNGYEADSVAIYCSLHGGALADMFTYMRLRRKVESIGFECSVNSDHAMRWLDKYRPDVAECIRRETQE